jgi:hypothetical protein
MNKQRHLMKIPAALARRLGRLGNTRILSELAKQIKYNVLATRFGQPPVPATQKHPKKSHLEP